MTSGLKRVFLVTLVTIVTLSCVSEPKPIQHAYHIIDVPHGVIIAIAKDAVAQMSVLFVPAKTKIALAHSATDQFGLAFIDELRRKGFSVKEHAPAQTLDEVLADHRQAHQKRMVNLQRRMLWIRIG